MHITVRMQVPRTSIVLAVVLVSPGTRGLVQRDATEYTTRAHIYTLRSLEIGDPRHDSRLSSDT